MILNVFLIFVFFICLAMLFSEGLWGATVTLINVIIAAMLATSLYEPVAAFLTQQASGYTVFWDFVAVWVVFAVSLLLFRLVTDKLLSRHKVRFKKPIDVGGGVFVAALIGWFMICFTLFTLHMAPLSRNFMGFQEEPTSRMFFGLAPDRKWLAFVHTMSEGGSLASDPANRVFDPRADFILKYGARRKQFESEKGLQVGR